MTAFSSAELIEALRRRLRRSLRPERPPGEFPPGWRDWFAAMPRSVGGVHGARAEAIVALLLQRTPRPPPRRSPELSHWQAFASLWRQQWQPPEPEDRRQRIAAGAITVVVHLVLAIALLWLAEVRFAGEPAPRGEDVVQVEFIGEGTPQVPGGGAPGGQVETRAAAAPARPGATARQAPAPQPQLQPPPSPSVAAPAAPPVTAAEPPAPAPEVAAALAQPLQVTQTPQPDSTFLLPAPVPRVPVLRQPQLTVPELREPVRTLEVAEAPAPAAKPVERIQPRLPAAQVAVPQLHTRVEALPAPVPLPDASARQVQIPQAQLTVPSLPAPAALPVAAAANAVAADAAAADRAPGTAGIAADRAAPASGAVPGAAATQSGGPPAPGSGSQAAATGTGTGPEPAARPGGWPSAQAGDDWGLSDRNRPGAQAGKPGLFDGDGRPRLPPGSQQAPGGGLPPGAVEERIANLDRAGTWLRRPPIDYTPTRFDRFWIPGETLLEEWVRRNIREVSIPIPGTSKKLRCVVSLLQLGGGCGITDPNLQDQEAGARPPPDVPFKPELQDK
ncbi:hypothetical protein [Cognatiluteimonas weifangensis]|uniref:Transmembrane repetitive protein n=1 Tax=Cognatiluteimonas weifangensis TaxID=2303539 RepID=A0A372DP28_9GAMM|nr:hypothetical protein [Luteimonas weifangensis]RFP61157.1 hypothetical protein D0Y53_05360 [Luteimonas weifangensis]